MNETITNNEVQNDGKRIHLYFNGLIGLYTSYGYSAYALSKKTEVHPAYSESMQMPVVVLNAAHLDDLVKRMTVLKHEKGYYLLEVDSTINEEEYSEWANKLRQGGGINL